MAGIRGVEWDAVELPSQFMENWCAGLLGSLKDSSEAEGRLAACSGRNSAAICCSHGLLCLTRSPLPCLPPPRCVQQVLRPPHALLLCAPLLLWGAAPRGAVPAPAGRPHLPVSSEAHGRCGPLMSAPMPGLPACCGHGTPPEQAHPPRPHKTPSFHRSIGCPRRSGSMTLRQIHFASVDLDLHARFTPGQVRRAPSVLDGRPPCTARGAAGCLIQPPEHWASSPLPPPLLSTPAGRVGV